MKKNWRPNPFFAHEFAHLQFSVLSNSEFNYSKCICSKWPEIQNLSSLDILKATHKKKLEAKPLFCTKICIFAIFIVFKNMRSITTWYQTLFYSNIFHCLLNKKCYCNLYSYNHWKSSSLTNVTPWKLFKFPFSYCSCSFWYLLVYT